MLLSESQKLLPSAEALTINHLYSYHQAPERKRKEKVKDEGVIGVKGLFRVLFKGV